MRPSSLFLGLVLLLSASGCARTSHRDAQAPTATPVPVSTAVVQLHSSTRHHSVTGTVRPAAHAIVAARLLARVERADLELGRSVFAGEIIVILDSADLHARLAQAEAAETRLANDLARDTRLLGQGAAAADNVRALKDQLRAATAATAEVRALLSHASVAAPFEGVITRRFVNAGDLATPGAPLFELENRSIRRAELDLPASLPVPTVGTVIRVSVGPNDAFGRLVEISSAIDPAARTRLVKVELPADLPADFGAYARAAWPAGTTQYLGMPAEALRRNGQMEQVFVVSQNRAALRLVKTDGTTGDQVRIVAGLSAGETVVLQPAALLRDGSPVELVR